MFFVTLIVLSLNCVVFEAVDGQWQNISLNDMTEGDEYYGMIKVRFCIAFKAIRLYVQALGEQRVLLSIPYMHIACANERWGYRCHSYLEVKHDVDNFAATGFR